jgi:transcription antitermination factor NusG
MIPLGGQILEPGARVRITGGTFAGFRGTLAGVKEGKVLVTIDIFGRAVTISLDPDLVRSHRPSDDEPPRYYGDS